MKSILDPSFQYTSSFNTDLRRTFARVRRDRLQNAQTTGQAASAALTRIAFIVRNTEARR
jgi:hypothetical protein